jgi:hypothetical protein
LWCNQQQKLGNLPPTGGDKYQIMRHDHQLGIDASAVMDPNYA